MTIENKIQSDIDNLVAVGERAIALAESRQKQIDTLRVQVDEIAEIVHIARCALSLSLGLGPVAKPEPGDVVTPLRGLTTLVGQVEAAMLKLNWKQFPSVDVCREHLREGVWVALKVKSIGRVAGFIQRVHGVVDPTVNIATDADALSIRCSDIEAFKIIEYGKHK